MEPAADAKADFVLIKKNKMNKDTIGTKIREARQNAGLTQKDLARKAKTSFETINRIENGKANTTVEMLLKLQNLLRIDIFK